MSETTTSTVHTPEQVQSQAAANRYTAMVARWSNAEVPEDCCESMGLAEYQAMLVRSAEGFEEEQHRLPRCLAELDAWLTGTKGTAFAAYLAAHPLPTTANQEPAAEQAKAPEREPADPNESTVEAEIEAQAELLAQSDKHLAAARKAKLKAEKGLRDGMLECGRESSDYIRCREMTGHDLDAIMDTLAGRLNAYSSRHPDRALILGQVAAFQACRLLCSDVNPTHTKKLAERLGTMAWGCFEQGWALLVQSKRKKSEGCKYVVTTYFLLRGMDADAWMTWLKANYAPATVGRTIKEARLLFKAAGRAEILDRNPFEDLKAGAPPDKDRQFFVTREVTQRVLHACPDVEWRLIVALSRYGGLRCPTEHLALTWPDVDWERGRFRVTSPKTEHYGCKGERWVPIFSELRPYLEEAFDLAKPGALHVITCKRDVRQNLRTRFVKIIRRAGLTPWPKPFQNLRASRETELAAVYPLHVVCAWIGNSTLIAQKHYLQVTEEVFRRGAESSAATVRTGSHRFANLAGNPWSCGC